MTITAPRVAEIRQIASSISGDRSLAVDVHEILDDLAVPVHYGVEPGDPDAYVSFAEDKPSIRLKPPASCDPTSLRTLRHVLAHELGHVVIDQEFRVRPTHGNYWTHENLCDEFAATLLIPDHVLLQVLTEDAPLTRSLELSLTLPRLANVPWELAARAVARARNCQLARIEYSSTGEFSTFFSTAGQEDGLELPLNLDATAMDLLSTMRDRRLEVIQFESVFGCYAGNQSDILIARLGSDRYLVWPDPIQLALRL